MFAEVLDALDTLLCGDDMLQRSPFFDVHSDPRSAYVTRAMILFLKMAIQRTKFFSRAPVQWSFFPKYQTQCNFVKELHLCCCSTPRSQAF